MKIQEYNKNGYFILREFFTHTEIDKLRSITEPIYKKWFSENQKDILKFKLVNMHSLSDAKYFTNSQDRINFFNEVCPKKLISCLREVFGNNITFNNTQLFFNPLDPNQKPYWHRDLQYSSVSIEDQVKEIENMLPLHVRIPLLAEKGLELIPGSHKRWDSELEGKVRYEQDGYTNDHPLVGAQQVDLKLGDIVIFNAQMLHKGIYDGNAERQALDICFGSDHPLLRPFLNPNVLPSSDKAEFIENKKWYHL